MSHPSHTKRILLGIMLLSTVTVVLLNREQISGEVIQQWLTDAGSAAPLLFILLYAIAAPLFFPGSVLTLAGGALFGPIWGSLYSLTGATIGAGIAFLIARTLAADWVTQKSGARLQPLIRGVEAEGWRFVAFVRLVPLFPFNLLNYALGLTRIRFSHYIIATYLCMLPGAVAYTYLGYAGREAFSGGDNLIQKGLLALALLAAVAFIPRLIRRFQHYNTLSIDQLQQSLQEENPPLLLDVRSEEDFKGTLRHIEQARNLPLESLEESLPSLSDHLQHPIALICTTDRRSKAAAWILEQGGFESVQVVTGGMTEWNQKNLPTV